MKQTTKNLRGGDYASPEMELCSTIVENGFSASLNAGGIDDATTEDWGTL